MPGSASPHILTLSAIWATVATWALVAGTLYGVWRQTKLSRDSLKLSRDSLKLNRDALEVSKGALELSRSALEAEVFTRLNQQWDAATMRQHRSRLANALLKRKGVKLPEEGAIKDVVDFFEELGIMLRRNLLSVEVVWQSFGDGLIYWWEVIGREFKEIEEDQLPGTAYYSEFEFVVEQMRAEDVRLKLPKMVITAAKRRRFLLGEAKLAVGSATT